MKINNELFQQPIKQSFLGITYGFSMIKCIMTTPVYIQDHTWISCDVKEHPALIEEPGLEKISAQHLINKDQLTVTELQSSAGNVFWN